MIEPKILNSLDLSKNIFNPILRFHFLYQYINLCEILYFIFIAVVTIKHLWITRIFNRKILE